MLKTIFWSKYMTWFRKLLGADKPDIKFEDVLKATGGSGKPRQGYYTSMSGINIKTYFEDHEGNFICVPEIQAVSVNHGLFNDEVQGEIITLLFDNDVLSHLPFPPKNMLMVATNEYGTLCYAKFIDFQFGIKRWAISIDDIVAEAHTSFTAVRTIPWTRVSDLRRFEDWEISLDEKIQEKLRKFE